MSIQNIMSEIAEHIQQTARQLDRKNVDILIENIVKADRIFLLGAGRSGLVAKAFAMRLSQTGLIVYVVGETITPGMKNQGDIFIILSGSGETKSVVSAAKVAKQIGTKIIAITSYPKSTLGRLSDHVVKVKGKTKIDIEKDHLKHQIEGVHSSLTPLGTLFEDISLIFLDGVIGEIMEKTKKAEKDMISRHANVE